MEVHLNSTEEIRKKILNYLQKAVIANMQDWGRRYPDAGYGGRFRHWLVEDKPRPYNNYDFFTNGGKQMQPMACVANC